MGWKSIVFGEQDSKELPRKGSRGRLSSLPGSSNVDARSSVERAEISLRTADRPVSAMVSPSEMEWKEVDDPSATGIVSDRRPSSSIIDPIPVTHNFPSTSTASTIDNAINMTSADTFSSIDTAKALGTRLPRTPTYHFTDEEVIAKGVRMLKEDFEDLTGDVTRWMERGKVLMDNLELLHGEHNETSPKAKEPEPLPKHTSDEREAQSRRIEDLEEKVKRLERMIEMMRGVGDVERDVTSGVEAGTAAEVGTRAEASSNTDTAGAVKTTGAGTNGSVPFPRPPSATPPFGIQQAIAARSSTVSPYTSPRIPHAAASPSIRSPRISNARPPALRRRSSSLMSSDVPPSSPPLGMAPRAGKRKAVDDAQTAGYDLGATSPALALPARDPRLEVKDDDEMMKETSNGSGKPTRTEVAQVASPLEDGEALVRAEHKARIAAYLQTEEGARLAQEIRSRMPPHIGTWMNTPVTANTSVTLTDHTAQDKKQVQPNGEEEQVQHTLPGQAVPGPTPAMLPLANTGISAPSATHPITSLRPPFPPVVQPIHNPVIPANYPQRTQSAAYSGPVASPSRPPVRHAPPAQVPVTCDYASEQALVGMFNRFNVHSLSNLVVDLCNKAIAEPGHTIIRTAILLTFKKAKDEHSLVMSKLCASLCQRIHRAVGPFIKDVRQVGGDGRMLAGYQLFERYVLKQCQAEFINEFPPRVSTSAVSSANGAVGQTTDSPSTPSEPDRKGKAVDRSHSVAQEHASRQRRIGLTTFVAECFKLEIISTKVIQSCIVKLLSNGTDPDEGDIEALCEFLKIVGAKLEAQFEMGAQVQLYIQRMQLLLESPHLSSNIKGMLQDVIDLQTRQWQPKPVERIDPPPVQPKPKAKGRKPIRKRR